MKKLLIAASASIAIIAGSAEAQNLQNPPAPYAVNAANILKMDFSSGGYSTGADSQNNVWINPYDPSGGSPALLVYGLSFNGSTWDRPRNITGAIFAGNTGIGNLAVEEAGRPFSHIATATSTVVKASKGFLHTLNIGTCVSGATVSLYDNASSATTPISVVTCPASTNGFSMTYDVAFSNGLYVVTSAATDVTVAYR